MDALLSGLIGILGGIISGLVIAIFSQRKNNAEIRRIEAETRKIYTELENKQINEIKEIFTQIHHLMHVVLGITDYIGRPKRGWVPLDGKSNEYILSFVEGSKMSKFEVQELLQAENKTKFYQEQELWYEFLELEEALHKFEDYIVEKEIFLENEEFIEACKDLGRLITLFSSSVRDAIKFDFREPAALAEMLPTLYEVYKPEFDPYEKQIDDYIKSQLRSKKS
jgi:hypothetical protein